MGSREKKLAAGLFLLAVVAALLLFGRRERDPAKENLEKAVEAYCLGPDKEPLMLELNGRAQSGPDGKLTYFLAYVTLEWLKDQAEGKFPP